MLLRKLIENKALNFLQIGEILEHRENGTRYRLIDNIAVQTLNQILKQKADSSKRQKFQIDQFETIRSFCLAADPTYFDMWESIRVIFEDKKSSSKNNKKTEKEFFMTFGPVITDRMIFHYWVHNYKGFSIYKLGFCYVAIFVSSAYKTFDVLKMARPQEAPPFILTAINHQKIIKRINSINDQKILDGKHDWLYGKYDFMNAKKPESDDLSLNPRKIFNYLIKKVTNKKLSFLKNAKKT